MMSELSSSASSSLSATARIYWPAHLLTTHPKPPTPTPIHTDAATATATATASSILGSSTSHLNATTEDGSEVCGVDDSDQLRRRVCSEFGYLIGWNVRSLMCCVVTIIFESDMKLEDIDSLLNKLADAAQYEHVWRHCEGAPTVIGVWNLPAHPSHSRDAIAIDPAVLEQLSSKKFSANIWLNLGLPAGFANSSASPTAMSSLSHQSPFPILRELYCCGQRYHSTAQFVIFERPTPPNYYSSLNFQFDEHSTVYKPWTFGMLIQNMKENRNHSETADKGKIEPKENGKSVAQLKSLDSYNAHSPSFSSIGRSSSTSSGSSASRSPSSISPSSSFGTDSRSPSSSDAFLINRLSSSCNDLEQTLRQINESIEVERIVDEAIAENQKPNAEAEIKANASKNDEHKQNGTYSPAKEGIRRRQKDQSNSAPIVNERNASVSTSRATVTTTTLVRPYRCSAAQSSRALYASSVYRVFFYPLVSLACLLVRTLFLINHIFTIFALRFLTFRFPCVRFSVFSSECLISLATFRLCDVSRLAEQTVRRLLSFSSLPASYLRMHTFQNNDGAKNTSSCAFYSPMYQIFLDVICGWIFATLLLCSPGLVLDILHGCGQILHLDVLRAQMVWMMGLPAGMKLNESLNRRLGSVVLLAVDGWDKLTTGYYRYEIYLLYGVAACGVFGVTFILSCADDVLSILTVHVRCAHSLFSSLYQLMLSALSSLWKLFRGKKRNILRKRIDSASYDMSQLMVGTLLFTLIFFLFPTLAIYHIFFSIVHTFIYVAQALFLAILNFWNYFPFFAVARLLLHRGTMPAGITVQVIHPKTKNMHNHKHSPSLLKHMHRNVVAFVRRCQSRASAASASPTCTAFSPLPPAAFGVQRPASTEFSPIATPSPLPAAAFSTTPEPDILFRPASAALFGPDSSAHSFGGVGDSSLHRPKARKFFATGGASLSYSTMERPSSYVQLQSVSVTLSALLSEYSKVLSTIRRCESKEDAWKKRMSIIVGGGKHPSTGLIFMRNGGYLLPPSAVYWNFLSKHLRPPQPIELATTQ